MVHPRHQRGREGGTAQQGEFPKGRGKGDLRVLVEAPALDQAHNAVLHVVRLKAGHLVRAQEARPDLSDPADGRQVGVMHALGENVLQRHGFRLQG